MKQRHIILVAAAAAVSVPVAAFAAHGKAGLWEMTVQTSMNGMTAAMPDMSKMPPEVQERMRKMGIQMGPHGTTVHKCLTEEQMKMGQPPMANQGDCRTTNIHFNGQQYSADVVCSGRMQGTGHVDVTYNSPESYSGMETTNMTENGHAVSSTIRFSGRWISADCGSVP